MRDFLRIRPVIRKSQARVQIVGKHGGPIWLKSIRRRQSFLYATGLLFIVLFICYSLIWQVEISGNDRLATDEIATVARKFGVTQWQWKRALADPHLIARSMQRELAGVAWLGVDVSGVKVRIKVVESDIAQMKPVRQGHHVIAAKTAVISKLFAERGQPVVTLQQKVNKGDVLISGWSGTAPAYRLIQTEGIAKGFVWYDIHMKVPLVRRYRYYSGEMFHRTYFFVGDRAFLVGGYGQPPFAKFETDTRITSWSPAFLRLPFGRMEETLRESADRTERITPSQAKQIGVQQARLHFLRNRSVDRAEAVVIRKEHILVQRQTKSHLLMSMFFEVEEEIGEYADVPPPDDVKQPPDEAPSQERQ